MTPPRKIVYFVFPRITVLDFIGVYDALRRVPNVESHMIGSQAEIADDGGLRFGASRVYTDLAEYDLLIVPGGIGTRTLMRDEKCLAWLRTWGETRPLASVCSGSLLLGEAGYLRKVRATTHHMAYHLLRPLCREVVTTSRVVDEGRIVTAGGVTCAIDLGLHLVEKFWGPGERTRVAREMQVPMTKTI